MNDLSSALKGSITSKVNRHEHNARHWWELTARHEVRAALPPRSPPTMLHLSQWFIQQHPTFCPYSDTTIVHRHLIKTEASASRASLAAVV